VWCFFFFSSRRRHTRFSRDWSSDVCSSDLPDTMGGGWETRRRRDGGEDWNIVRLGVPGRVRTLRLDTRHFKGNYPPLASVDGLRSEERRVGKECRARRAREQ